MIVYQTDHFKVELEPTPRPDTLLILIKAPRLQYSHTKHIQIRNGKPIEQTALRYAQDIAKSLYLETKSIYENIHPDV